MLSLCAPRRQQEGMALFIALVVLVMLALATAAMLRSAGTGILVGGNLANQQAAVGSSDQAVESAVAWLENNHSASSSSTATAAPCSPAIRPITATWPCAPTRTPTRPGPTCGPP